MKLHATLRRSDGTTADIAITAEPTARIGDIAAQIMLCDPARSDRYPDALDGLTLEVRSLLSQTPVEALDPTDTFEDVSLADGVELAVVALAETPRAEVAYLQILSGPDAGSQITLGRGSSVIGRDASCDIVLSDRTASKRHARLHVGQDRIELIDLNSANGVLVHGEPSGRVSMTPQDVVTLGSTSIRAGFLPAVVIARPEYVQISFTRSPAVEPRYIGTEIEGADPPVPGEAQPFPWLALAMPLIAGGALFAVTRSPLSLIFVAISPVMMLGTWLTAWSTKRRKAAQDRARFTAQLERLKKRLAREYDAEAQIRRREAPSLHDVYAAVMSGGHSMWTRRPEHWSFRHLRLGVGDLPSRNTVRGPGNPDRVEPDDLAQIEQTIDAFSTIAGVPVVEDLGDAGVLGLCGEQAATAAYLRGIVAQWTGLHGYTDTVVGAVLGPSWSAELAELNWIPHVSRSTAVFGGAPIGDSAATAGRVVACVEEIIDARTPHSQSEPLMLGALGERQAAGTTGGAVGEKSGNDDTAGPLPAVILLITHDAPVDRPRLIQLCERAAGRGVYPIWVGPSRADLPAACRTYVELLPSGHAEVGQVRLGMLVDGVQVEGLGREDFARFARRLAMYSDAGELSTDASDVPRTISMLQLLGKDLAADDAAVIDRWQQNGSLSLPGLPPPSDRQAPRLRAIVGQSAAGALHLDLRSQGPHALVGGTTGSGKSEFLQAWVLGMAAEYSPQRVTFLFVDYKGGAAFAECTRLPHCVGLVTDLSPHLVRRALVSLRAELHHRETLFTRKKAKDLIELEKRGDPETPPALVIVIDEFAALVNEVPEFVDGVVDVAQRGRSLGIHLIMATQRPAGVIKDNLRANTNLRIALRVADETDSDDVIGTKDAAHFDPDLPGRAAAKTGPGRLTVFQSAYAGGWSFGVEEAPDIALETFGFGAPARWEKPKRAQTDEDRDLGPTDQQRLVDTMVAAAKTVELPAPRRPWLDELADVYDLTRLRQRTDSQLLLGVQDIPQRQTQATVYFEPDAEGHIAVFGTGGSGKSSTLRTLAVAAGITPRGGPVDVYGLDFGSGGLRMLEPLPHVGAIIPADSGERVARLFRMLRAELDRRTEAYARVNAGTITEYRTLADAPDEARILLLIDGFAAFRTEFEGALGRAEVYAAFQQILADGRAAGIHVALTADRGQAVPSSLQAMIQKRVVLRMADADQYGMLGVPRDVLSTSSPAGRALVDSRETQIAVIAGTADVREQARAIAEFADTLRRRGRPDAPPVRPLPELFDISELPANADGRPVLGMSGIDLGPVGFDPTGLFIVAGAPQSGRTNALAVIAESLHRTAPETEVYLLCSARSPLAARDGWAGVATSGTAASALAGELSRRDSLDNVAVLIEGTPEFAASLAELSLADLVKRAKRGEGLVVADAETGEWNTGFGLMGDLRAARRGLILQPDSHDGDVVFKTPFPRLVKRDFPPGRGLLVTSGKSAPVQLPLVLTGSSPH